MLYGHGYNATELRHLMIKRDLPSFVDEDEVYRLAGDVLNLAAQGLKRRGKGEERYLEPLFERVERHESPAAYMLRRLSEGSTIEELVKEYS